MALDVPCNCGKRFNVRVPDHVAAITKQMICPGCGAELNGMANRMLAESRRAAQLQEAPLFEAADPNEPVDAEDLPRSASASAAASPLAPTAAKADGEFAVAMNRPQRHGRSLLDDDGKQKLSTGEQVWCALPLALIAVGGLIGGACGGAAYGINQAIFKQTKNPIRYVLTAGVTIAAGAVWFMMVAALAGAMRRY